MGVLFIGLLVRLLQTVLLKLKAGKVAKYEADAKIDGIIRGWDREQKKEAARTKNFDNEIRKKFLYELSSDEDSNEGSSDEDKAHKRVMTKLTVLKYLQKIREKEEESEDSDNDIRKVKEIRTRFRNIFVLKLTSKNKHLF